MKKIKTKYKVLIYLIIIFIAVLLASFALRGKQKPDPVVASPVAAEQNTLISKNKALALVANLPDVKNFVALLKSKSKISVMEAEPDTLQYGQASPDPYWQIHVYEDLPDHIATMGWYSVDAKTGEVKDEIEDGN